MSKIEDLIKQYCPDGVEWKRLGDTSLFRISRGVVISKSYIAEHHGQYPVYSSQTENDGCLGCIDTYAIDGERITWTTDGAKAGTVFYRSGKYNITNVCGMIECVSSDISCKYVSYVFGVEAPKFVNKAMGNCKLMSNVVENILIPIPHIAVQDEIVRILDEYTDLEAELEAKLSEEIKLKQKQYEVYRDELLTFGDDVEYKKIRDVYTRLRGTPITAGKMKEIADENGDVRIFAGGKTVINAFEKDIPKANITRVPAVLVQSRGVIDFVYYDKPFTFKNEMWAYTHENTMSVQYLCYVLKNNAQTFRNEASGMGSMPQISLSVTEDFEIPVPSITEQERIVKILDKYDTYTRDMISTLNTELEFRKKQYAYYRDQLLTFKRKE